MQRMDGIRRAAGLMWLAAGLAFQLWWLVVGAVVPGVVTLVLIGSVVLLGMAVLVRCSRLTRIAAAAVAVALALAFGGAVADRFGVFGGPGAEGVSWGSWSVFLGYTARMLPGTDDRLTALAAVGATVVEVVLSLMLLLNQQRRWVAKAAAGLLVVYLMTMLWSLGAAEVARYGVPALVGGALLLSSCPPTTRKRVPAGAVPAPASLGAGRPGRPA